MEELKKILVPTDFSQCSEQAVKCASTLADKSNAELHLLNVQPPEPSREAAGATRDEKLRLARTQLNQSLTPQAELKLTVLREAVEGSPSKEIREYAERHDIDLIVIGTHGRTGLAHVVLGSVAEKVLRTSSCPVLVVPSKFRRDQLQLNRAAQTVHEHFGDRLPGGLAQTRAQIKGRLMRDLEVSDLNAIKLVEQLEASDVLTWNEPPDSDADTAKTEGFWRIEPDRLLEQERAPQLARAVDLSGESAPALDLVRRALSLRATDIHIDPTGDDDYAVRFRIDGRLEPYCHLSTDVAEHLTHQFRIIASLELVDRFRPQEGRLRLPPSIGSNLEVRITTAPVSGGDATALRLFSLDNVFFPLSKLGFSPQSLSAITEMLQQGEGIVLITGPTGTGKTTTVYSMLEYLASGQRNIVSIEDPVEFAAPFVRQMNVDESHGVTMTRGLRTLLRMDPDIIFLGEIRDAEAVEIAMRAAASGRHVFSTLHTRDVAATVTALRDLNVEKRSLSGNLRGIVNQRLLRRLCTECCKRSPITDLQRQVFAENALEPPSELAHPVGCDVCRGTGYHGRIGVFEAAVAVESFAKAIIDNAPEDELRSLIRSAGTPSLTMDALAKVSDGITSLTEAVEMHWI